ncbi:MAG: hypothetical protein ACO1RA_17210 [Planctomycetaceae bacterium]
MPIRWGLVAALRKGVISPKICCKNTTAKPETPVLSDPMQRELKL